MSESRTAALAEMLGKMNDRQLEAVKFPLASSLVLAGAGSGKTSVLTTRIAYLVEHDVNPESIVAVTFTTKAAQEMRKRLQQMVGEDAQKMWIGTFHSLCNRILRREYEAAELPKNFAILDEDGQETMIRQIVKDFKYDIEVTPPATVRGWINKKKEFEVNPWDVNPSPGSIEEQFCVVYSEYRNRCKKQGVLDFNDLLQKATYLLEMRPDISGRYRTEFRAILVDEFQDTNDIQYRWLKQIVDPRHGFVMAVGDDDQSIYGFRGANPANMARFVREFADGALIRLERNYRSQPHILSAANALIANNSNRLGKNLWTAAEKNESKVSSIEYSTGKSEAVHVARRTQSLIKGKCAPSEIAVLYRTNSQSRAIEQEMNRLGVPITVYGGFRFYDRQEVKRVLNYLDLIVSIDRDIAFAHVVNFPPRGIGERSVETLRQLARATNLSMMEAIAERDSRAMSGRAATTQRNLENFAEMILEFSDRAGSEQLSSLLPDLIRRSGLHDHYQSEPDGPERLENLAEMASAIRQFEIDNPSLGSAAEILPEFMAFVQLTMSTSEADISKKHTVSLMTIHASKGLEFDNVFLVGMEEGLFPHSRSIQEESEGGNAIEEERRLMYVALTRARTHLELSCAQARILNGKDNSFPASRFLTEIPANLLDPRTENEVDFEVFREPPHPPMSAATAAGLRRRIGGLREMETASEIRTKTPTPTTMQAGENRQDMFAPAKVGMRRIQARSG